MIEWIILGIIALFIALFAVALIVTYNAFVTLKNRIANAWAQIDVNTKKRYDMIPNLVEIVKGYAKHEKAVFTEVTKARAAVSQAGEDVSKKAKAENMLTGTLKSLFAVSENYPELKANENFKMLQEELSGVESKIAYARQFYNDNVLEFNQKTEVFPSNIIAGMFGFKVKPYFEIEEEARKNVKISF